MIAVKCAVCGRELDEPGAILLSPPDKNDNVVKFHLCIADYNNLTVSSRVKRRYRG